MKQPFEFEPGECVTVDPDDILLVLETGKEFFYEEAFLAFLLLNEYAFLNSSHWKKEWSEDDRKRTSVLLNISDVFAWGVADAEILNYKDLEPLFRLYQQYGSSAMTLYAMILRKERPKPLSRRVLSRTWERTSTTNSVRTTIYDQIGIVVSVMSVGNWKCLV